MSRKLRENNSKGMGAGTKTLAQLGPHFDRTIARVKIGTCHIEAALQPDKTA